MARVVKLVTTCLFIVCFCSINQLAKAQSFLINTNADDCEVFVEDVKVGTGKSIKILLDKKHILKQIKVTRPGYLPMHEVAFYGDKEISINVERKTYKSATGTSTIALKTVYSSESEGYTYHYDYELFRKKQFEPVYHGCFDKTAVRDFQRDAPLYFVKGIASTGVVDTNYTMLNSENYKCLLETTLKLARCYFYETSKNCNQMAMQIEVEVQYEFKDKFGKDIYNLRKGGKSGIYSLDGLKWLTIDSDAKRKIINNKMEEAIANSLYDLIADSAAHVIFEDDEPLAASKLESLRFKNTSNVTDMKSALKATVTIKTGESFGSGCVVSNDGYILTSYHVIAEVEDSVIQILSNTGDTISGKVVRTSKSADLALIKTSKTFPFAFSLLGSTEIEVTDEVLAIGTPASMELSQTVSKGIVSAIRKNGDKHTIIQTDVSVNPGNSGGPLLKLPGVFIGVVNSKISGGRMEGLGFCTPVFDVITHLKLSGK
ncbi:MAG: S1C family serine protease [Bacteroidia bacterium]